jgi:LCP family protein required for cell wall assembly
MTDHDSDVIIRQAIAAEANQAVDPDTVLAGLRAGKRTRRRPGMLVAVAGMAVVAGVIAVVVPLLASRDNPDVRQVPAAPATTTEQNILLIGLDGSGYTDSVVLARLGVDGALRAVSLPRDSWVDIPGIGMDKLNQAYAKARMAAAGKGSDTAAAETAGAQALVATVQALTGVRIDHYAAVDMAGFGRLSAAIGGVEVCLRSASRDRFADADFPAGRQTLSGASALAFVRQRHGLPNGDLDRVVRQQAFLRALVTKIVHGNVRTDPKALAALLAAVTADVRIDQSWNLADFARRLTPDAPVGLATIPIAGESTVHGGGSALVVEPAAVRTFVGDFLSGSPTGGPAPQTGSPAPQNIPCVN